MAKDKSLQKASKNAQHCRGGLGGVCNDRDALQSVIKNIGNADGAPSQNPK